MKCLSSCSGYCDPSDVTHCLGCTEGFQLKDNECVRCPEGCSSCSGEDCGECYNGFEIHYDADNDKFMCKKECKFPCNECEDDVCSGCVSMFNLENGQCVPDTSCNPDCGFCPAGTIRNDVTNDCDSCSSNCASCNTNECLECFSGFYLENSVCEPCTSNCEVCSNSLVCEICEDTYLLTLISETEELKVYDFLCTACDENCVTCVDKPDICLTCDDNHRLKNTKCINRFTVGFVFVFNTDFATFLENSEMQELI